MSATTYETTASAYTSHVNQTDSTPFINAMGKRCQPDDVACNFLPFGTKVKIYVGNKIYYGVVRDRMKSNKKIDLYFGLDRHSAIHFGKKKVMIEVIE
jgi:3D (Asp-Asp-Asp) domain-containing protein